MNFARELEVALLAAAKASQHLERLYAEFQAIPNAPANITTEADREAQEIILRTLLEHFPTDSLCAEEQTATLATVPHVGERLWIVDPIDGTRGFAQKVGEFSVMIGFVALGKIKVGVVAEPAKQRVTYASRGQGCWCTVAGSAPARCRVTAVEELSQATLTQSRPKPKSPPSQEVTLLQPANIVETYSAGIKLALVARGEADLYVNNYPAFSDWDICAGQILVEEAGGQVTGLKGQTLQYGLPGAKQAFGLLATNGLLHEPVLAKLT